MADEALVEDVVGALQQQRRMRQERDQPACGHGRASCDLVAVAPLADEVADERARIGAGDRGVGGAHVAQPAEAAEHLGPGLARRHRVEGGIAMAAEGAPGEGEIAGIDVAGGGRVGRAQVLGGEEQAGRMRAAEGPETMGCSDELAAGTPRRAADRCAGKCPSVRPAAQCPRMPHPPAGPGQALRIPMPS